ncbi:MAG: hypothetical protein ACYCOX_18700 [Acidobacteriaceae bacterium]
MKPIFYTNIRPAHGQTESAVIKKAHVLGFELVRFNGYSDADIGYAGNRGPKYDESRENLAALREIQDACMVSGDWPHITQGE